MIKDIIWLSITIVVLAIFGREFLRGIIDLFKILFTKKGFDDAYDEFIERHK